ncbi:PrsW family glutamic-type intramembrane protease [Dongia sp.]|uniref:PrsW family glutamic-type intramembrane protease n=1 Tax=Dongia sp. TaxID=1977262 RepID=UPI0035B1F7E6
MIFSFTLLAAILPPLFLIAFFLTHFRHRLGLGLGAKSVVGGMISAPLAIGFAVLLSRLGLPHDGLMGAASKAWLGAAIPEEMAKFLIVWFYIRRHPQCDSGGDLFCGAALVGLGFALLENILYLLNADNWMMTGVLRGAMAVPGHTIDGMMMGVFLAWWWRKDILPPAAIFLALILPILAHGFYDFPLMALDAMQKEYFDDPERMRHILFGLYVTTIVISGAAAIWAGRMEMVEVFLRTRPDIDLHPPHAAGIAAWRWIGRLLILGAVIVALVGLNTATSEDVLEGGWLIAIAVFPASFGIVMARKLPDQAYKPLVTWPRAARR